MTVIAADQFSDTIIVLNERSLFIYLFLFCPFRSNIDTRIQQAELEYQLGREELNLLSLMEDVSKHKCRLEEIEQHIVQNENNTLYK